MFPELHNLKLTDAFLIFKGPGCIWGTGAPLRRKVGGCKNVGDCQFEPQIRGRTGNLFFYGQPATKNSDLCVLCKYLWWISETPKIISRDDEWAWIIAEPLPGIPHGTENNTMPGPGAEKVRRNEDLYSSVWCAVLGATSLIRILCHLHIHLQQVGGRHLGWQQHLAINSLGW